MARRGQQAGVLPADAHTRCRTTPHSGGTDGKTKVLFVCLGNICRSPSAEAVFNNGAQLLLGTHAGLLC